MITKEMAATEKMAVSREAIRRLLLSDQPTSSAPLFQTTRATALALLQPIAQSRPFTLVAGAFLIGGLLAYNQSTSRKVVRALAKELLPRLAPIVVAAVSKPDWSDIAEIILNQAGRSKQ
ncbi:MAG: hypothetical protein RL032_208 [Pseudomonadota bacterium]|jgi:hypothetical protein